MNAHDLHTLVDPIREAMVEDGIWPTRYGVTLEYSSDEYWEYPDDRVVHYEDAHNSVLVALLGWLPKDHILCRSIYEDGTSEWTVEEELTHCNAIHGSGTVPIHALVSAYRTEKGLQ